jgi:hypothetical protein
MSAIENIRKKIMDENQRTFAYGVDANDYDDWFTNYVAISPRKPRARPEDVPILAAIACYPRAGLAAGNRTVLLNVFVEIRILQACGRHQASSASANSEG